MPKDSQEFPRRRSRSQYRIKLQLDIDIVDRTHDEMTELEVKVFELSGT